MSSEEFRRWGREVIDWIADYHERVETLPVLSRVEPGAIRRALPEHPPEQGEGFERMLADLDEKVLPGITHWQSPNFFAFFPANVSYPSILGELLSAGLGVQGMLWTTSPACTEIETLVLDWVVELLDLPRTFHSSGAGGGVIQDSASSATLCALLAARHRAAEAPAEALVAYASTEAHSSVDKAMEIAGLGRDRLRRIAVDADRALDPAALSAAMAEDRAAGRRPFFVVATVGTTSSLAFDPLDAVGAAARAEGAWLHVDAAMAGTAAVCPELRWIHRGLEQAQSYCFNPHKWMFTNFDCDCFYVSDRQALIDALSVVPEYLRNRASESGQVIDYRDWQVPLGRRFRALKLWFVIRHYGIRGLRAHVRRHVELAAGFARWVESHPELELAAPCRLNLVCFRHRRGDRASEDLLEALNASEKLYLTHTRLDGRYVLRMSIGQTRTESRHVEQAREAIDAIVSNGRLPGSA
ncbi:MAG TPA: aspartate aminotransferase family protein [Acidobacteria bacterium]|nr:aspartate aminotransferase family protein [Acidobacteriota bacterium]